MHRSIQHRPRVTACIHLPDHDHHRTDACKTMDSVDLDPSNTWTHTHTHTHISVSSTSVPSVISFCPRRHPPATGKTARQTQSTVKRLLINTFNFSSSQVICNMQTPSLSLSSLDMACMGISYPWVLPWGAGRVGMGKPWRY